MIWVQQKFLFLFHLKLYQFLRVSTPKAGRRPVLGPNPCRIVGSTVQCVLRLLFRLSGKYGLDFQRNNTPPPTPSDDELTGRNKHYHQFYVNLKRKMAKLNSETQLQSTKISRTFKIRLIICPCKEKKSTSYYHFHIRVQLFYIFFSSFKSC